MTMRLPGFLKRGQSEGNPFPDDRVIQGYAARGCLIGLVVALFLWVVPIPVVIVVWLFDLKGPFSDYMIMATPFFVILPILGVGIAQRYGRRHEARWRNR